MLKPLLVIAFIMVLSNPVYNVDAAHVNYTMALSATGEPLGLSYDISSDIDISQAGVCVVDVDTGDIPLDWTDDVSDAERPIFILSKAEIAAMSVTINGETIALQQGGKEMDVTKRYYGATLLVGSSAQAGDSMTLEWNAATGIVLSIHAEMEEGGENIVIDVEYQSSDVDIYSDQSTIEKGWNQFVLFAMTPLGIIIMIAVAIAVIVLCVVFRVPKKVKRAVRRH